MKWPFVQATPVIRALRAEDAEDCAALHKTGFAHAWSALEFEALLSSRAVSGSAAVGAGDSLAGFLLCRTAAGEAEVLTIIVATDRRRRGLGMELMRDQFGRLASVGASSIVLEVDERNTAARALYAKMGFAPVGRRPAYYRGSDGRASTALILRADL